MLGLSLGAWPFILLLVLLPIGWAALQRRRVRMPLPGIGEAAGGRSGGGRSDGREESESLPPEAPVRLRRFTVWSAWVPLWRTAALVLTVLALASPVRLVERV
ncbi:MAG: hypothetical protein ACYTGG_13935, partial [Planctomycetota bacterium]